MPKQIITFNITKLLVGAHYDFHSDIYSYISAATPEALHVETQAPAYLALIQKQLDIINRNRNVAMTDELAALDKERDNWLGQLTRTVDTAAASPDGTTAETGRKLQRILSPYRGIAGNEYTKQTAQLRGLLRDLGADEVAPLIDAITLGAIIQKLRQANNAFNNKYNERITAEASRTRSDVGTTDNRRAMDEAYRGIVQIINAYAITATTDVIDTFIDKVNARIEQGKRIITRQAPGGSGNEKRTAKLQKAADKMGKALARMETAKAEYEKRQKEYDAAKAEYEALVNG